MIKYIFASLILFWFTLGTAAQSPKAGPQVPAKKLAKPTTVVAKQKVTVPAHWTETERSNFLKTCIPATKMEEGKAELYCTCMLGKIEKLYPNAAMADNKLTSEKATALAKTCLGASPTASGWSAAERTTFLKECNTTATKTIGATKAKAYCSCMQVKVETAYPVSADVKKMTVEEMNKWAVGCNEE